MIKISVIMPAYNVENYIQKSVESVMAQTLKDIELIIINDASKDSTWDRICDLKEKYGPRIKAINLERNVRQGGARNRGLKIAQGEYIAFVDSDDFIAANMLEEFYNAISQNDADLAGTNKSFIYYSKDKIIETGDNSSLLELSGRFADKNIKEMYLLRLGGIWRNIYKRDIIINNNIWFPEGLSYEDNYFFVLYLAYVKKFVCVDDAFYYYRQNLNSTVHRKDYTQLQRVAVFKLILEEYKKRGLYNDVKDAFEVMCIYSWYSNTIGFWFNRLGRESIKFAIEMSREFRSLFPNYRKNKYYKTHLSRIERLRLRVLEISPRFLYLLYSIKKHVRNKKR